MITLVGMPGGGKSTVGRHLSRQMGMRFVDSDTEIELRLGETIRAFFDRQGEAAFFISPFVDYSGDDGLFRKYRITFIDGQPFANRSSVLVSTIFERQINPVPCVSLIP